MKKTKTWLIHIFVFFVVLREGGLSALLDKSLGLLELLPRSGGGLDEQVHLNPVIVAEGSCVTQSHNLDRAFAVVVLVGVYLSLSKTPHLLNTVKGAE